jgi:mono/diheme cytochrome c family protein
MFLLRSQTLSDGKLSTEIMTRPRTWQRVGFVVAALGVLPFLLALENTPKAHKVVDAEKFILRAADGKARAELALQAGWPSLILLDEQGHSRVRLALSADGAASLSLYNRDGRRRVTVRVPPEGDVSLDVDRSSAVEKESASSGASSQGASPSFATGKVERKQAAQGLFHQLCVRCHGGDGRGRPSQTKRSIPDFTRADWQAAHTDAQLIASLLTGVGDSMPAFEGRINSAQARDLVAVIRTFGPAKKTASIPADDFEVRFRQLQQEYDALQKQLNQLPSSGHP